MSLSHHWSLAGSQPVLASEERRREHLLELERARCAQRALEPSPRARLVARVLGGRLDRALIAGADPAASPSLAARAAMLTSPAARSEIADGLELLLARAQRPPRRNDALARHSAVLANAALVRELSATLRGPAPLYARGVAMLHHLLTDGTGPVYVPGERAALEAELKRARAAVCG